MQRFNIALHDALAGEFDQLIAERGYDNRSEAVRDLLRVIVTQHSGDGKANQYFLRGFDRHVHPNEPRSLRLTLALRF